MQAGALRPYEQMLDSMTQSGAWIGDIEVRLTGGELAVREFAATTVGLAPDAAQLDMVTAEGQVLPLDLHRWVADADAADHSVIDRCAQPTLDIGCGPGRMVRGLYARGVHALGVDIAAAAVELSNRRGGPALLADVFGPLPGAGRWASILLLDGNVGIGGDVERLLCRSRDLLAQGGCVIAETSPWFSDADVARHSVHFRVDGVTVGREFVWALVSEAGLRAAAEAAGLRCSDRWVVGGRCFLQLVRAR